MKTLPSTPDAPASTAKACMRMAFVALSGAQGGRPTFFEMVAAERLMPSLKSAAAYSLSVRKRGRV